MSWSEKTNGQTDKTETVCGDCFEIYRPDQLVRCVCGVIACVRCLPNHARCRAPEPAPAAAGCGRVTQAEHYLREAKRAHSACQFRESESACHIASVLLHLHAATAPQVIQVVGPGEAVYGLDLNDLGERSGS